MTDPIKGMDIDALAAQAAELEDFTKETKGGFTRELIPEGPCFIRLREYVEIGEQNQAEWKVKAYGKKPAKPQAMWTFEVVAAVRKRAEDHEKAGERYNAARRTITPDGKDSFEVCETISITTDISTNGKSGHFKLFKALNAPYGIKYQHPAQMLACPGWKARIVHSWKKDDKNEDGTPKENTKPSYQNLRNDQGWTFEAPVKEDPETGDSTRIKVPELLGGPGTRKLFLWDQPNRECWDALFIEGERDEMKDGKATGKKLSKNWMQEKMRGAVNYGGSALSVLLSDVDDLADMAMDGVDTPQSAGAVDDDPLADLD